MSPPPTPPKADGENDEPFSMKLVLFDALWGVLSMLFGIAAVATAVVTEHHPAAEMTAVAGLLLTCVAILIWWWTSKLDLRIHSIAMLLNTAALAFVFFYNAKLTPAIEDTRVLLEEIGLIGDKSKDEAKPAEPGEADNNPDAGPSDEEQASPSDKNEAPQ